VSQSDGRPDLVGAKYEMDEVNFHLLHPWSRPAKRHSGRRQRSSDVTSTSGSCAVCRKNRENIIAFITDDLITIVITRDDECILCVTGKM